MGRSSAGQPVFSLVQQIRMGEVIELIHGCRIVDAASKAPAWHTDTPAFVRTQNGERLEEIDDSLAMWTESSFKSWRVYLAPLESGIW